MEPIRIPLNVFELVDEQRAREQAAERTLAEQEAQRGTPEWQDAQRARLIAASRATALKDCEVLFDRILLLVSAEGRAHDAGPETHAGITASMLLATLDARRGVTPADALQVAGKPGAASLGALLRHKLDVPATTTMPSETP